MKKRITRLIAGWLVTLLLATPAIAASSFPDVGEDAAYAEAVEVLSDMDIMVGDETGHFNPDKPVTRAEMAAIICRVLGETENLPMDSSLFPDVADCFWGNGYIIKAATLDIIKGYEDGSFHPDDTVTYAQALTMVVRTMGLEETAIALGGYPGGYIKAAEENGFAGEFTASPEDLLMRWQVAEIIFALFL
ncbi:MAG: S-layer homology domain-containing protein [Oscillibacter sp.]|nr:S-layer homology domain-containing protein [Oscillibacter sp.]